MENRVRQSSEVDNPVRTTHPLRATVCIPFGGKVFKDFTILGKTKSGKQVEQGQHKQGRKGPSAQKPICWVETEEERADLT